MSAPKLARGLVFTHDRYREHVPGVRVADSPYVRMRVSRVTSTTVYYTHLDGKGRTCTSREDFERRFLA